MRPSALRRGEGGSADEGSRTGDRHRSRAKVREVNEPAVRQTRIVRECHCDRRRIIEGDELPSIGQDQGVRGAGLSVDRLNGGLAQCHPRAGEHALVDHDTCAAR